VIKTKDTKKAHFLQYVYAKINEKSKSVLKYIMLYNKNIHYTKANFTLSVSFSLIH